MENILTLTVHSDPGHAWVELPKDIADRIGMQASACSYESFDALFLEEDCDAVIMLYKLAANGISQVRFKDKTYNGNAPLRHFIPVTDKYRILSALDYIIAADREGMPKAQVVNG